jgi:hypothetical protein
VRTQVHGLFKGLADSADQIEEPIGMPTRAAVLALFASLCQWSAVDEELALLLPRRLCRLLRYRQT